MEENILRGQVVLSNTLHGTYAIKVFEGDITVIEALGEPAMNIGDIVSGNLESLGAQHLVNETNGDLLEVFVESVYCSIEEALCCLGFKQESTKDLREEDF
jgi:hypothetical protein